MAANVKRVEPFEASNSRTRSCRRDCHFHGGFDGGLDLCNATSNARGETICLGKAASGFADFADVVPNSGERLRLKRQNLGRKRHARQCGGKVVGRSGTYMAQILSDYEIRGEGTKQDVIDSVDALAATDEFADLAVKFDGRRSRINARADERRFLAGLRRKIAFVRDANNRIAEAERVEYFRGGREKRDDAHGASLHVQKVESKFNAKPWRRSTGEDRRR